jgi:hypothetical protein
VGADKPEVAFCVYVAFFDWLRGVGSKPGYPIPTAARKPPAR